MEALRSQGSRDAGGHCGSALGAMSWAESSACCRQVQVLWPGLKLLLPSSTHKQSSFLSDFCWE